MMYYLGVNAVHVLTDDEKSRLIEFSARGLTWCATRG